MKDSPTAQALLAAAGELFPAHGYDATSIRAITARANVNLGAVTYHFGSKEALYEALFAHLAEPFREHVAAIGARPGPALERIVELVQAVFEYLAGHPRLWRLLIQHLAGARPLPEPARRVLEANHRVISELIAAGQREGTIRSGDPRLMSLNIIAQPIWISLVRDFLRQALGIDQDDPATRKRVADSTLQFVRAGLATTPEDAP
jgi:AcrR family transcriptional regulator